MHLISAARYCLPAIALALGACAAQRAPHSPVHAAAKAKSTQESAPAQSSKAPAQDKHSTQKPAQKYADALAPAEVGYYMDVLLGRLRQVPGVECKRREDHVLVLFAGGFDMTTGHVQADADMRATLTALAQVLTEYRKTLVTVQVQPIEPADPLDPQLAQRCALATAHLLATAGLTSKRVAVATAEPNGALPANVQSSGPVRLELMIAPLIQADSGSP